MKWNWLDNWYFATNWILEFQNKVIFFPYLNVKKTGLYDYFQLLLRCISLYWHVFPLLSYLNMMKTRLYEYFELLLRCVSLYCHVFQKHFLCPLLRTVMLISFGIIALLPLEWYVQDLAFLVLEASMSLFYALQRTLYMLNHT